MTGLKLPHITHSREVTVIFHFFDKPDATRYELILGSHFKHIIGIEILNGALYFIYHEIQATMVDMGYWNYNIIDDYKYHRAAGEPCEYHNKAHILYAKDEKPEL